MLRCNIKLNKHKKSKKDEINDKNIQLYDKTTETALGTRRKKLTEEKIDKWFLSQKMERNDVKKTETTKSCSVSFFLAPKKGDGEWFWSFI